MHLQYCSNPPHSLYSRLHNPLNHVSDCQSSDFLSAEIIGDKAKLNL